MEYVRASVAWLRTQTRARALGMSGKVLDRREVASLSPVAGARLCCACKFVRVRVRARSQIHLCSRVCPRKFMLLTFCRRLVCSMPPIHQVILAGGREPVASHSTSYGRSEDSG